MLPIFLCSFFSLSIIIERFLFYRSIRLDYQAILSKVFECVRKNRISQAFELCEKTPFFIINIIKAGLLYHEESKESIKEAMESASLYEIPVLEKNLNFLELFVYVLPLLGFLGTALGLAKTFYGVEKTLLKGGALSILDLSGGIWEALLSTIFSWAIVIPTYIAYHYFLHKARLYKVELERAQNDFLEALAQRRNIEKD